jgi:hypothetical protein
MSELSQAMFGNERGLDCVRMKQELQSHIFEATKDMTRAERTAYREQQAEKFRRRLEHLAPAMAAEIAAQGTRGKCEGALTKVPAAESLPGDE